MLFCSYASKLLKVLQGCVLVHACHFAVLHNITQTYYTVTCFRNFLEATEAFHLKFDLFIICGGT